MASKHNNYDLNFLYFNLKFVIVMNTKKIYLPKNFKNYSKILRSFFFKKRSLSFLKVKKYFFLNLNFIKY